MKACWIIAIISVLMFSCNKESKETDNNLEITDNDSLTGVHDDFFLFPDSAQWIETRAYETGVSHPFYDIWFYNIDTSWFNFTGDTVILRSTMLGYGDTLPEAPHTYKKLFWKRKNYSWNLPDEIPGQSAGTLTVTYGYAAFLRQDTTTRRVYIAPNNSYFHSYPGQREYILYDFSLNVGDKLPFNAWNGFLSNIYVVDSVIYTNISGKLLKTYKIYENSYYYRGTIIEGVGGIDGFLNLSGELIYYHGNGIEYHTP